MFTPKPPPPVPHPCFLSTSRDCDSTTALGSHFQCITTTSIWEFFRISHLNFPWCNLRRFPLIPSLGEEFFRVLESSYGSTEQLPGPLTWGQAGNPCLDGTTAGPGTRGDLFQLDPMECCRLEENHAPDAASGFRKLLDFQVIQSSSTEEKIPAQRGNVAAQRAPGSTKPLEALMRGILGLFPN